MLKYNHDSNISRFMDILCHKESHREILNYRKFDWKMLPHKLVKSLDTEYLEHIIYNRDSGLEFLPLDLDIAFEMIDVENINDRIFIRIIYYLCSHLFSFKEISMHLFDPIILNFYKKIVQYKTLDTIRLLKNFVPLKKNTPIQISIQLQNKDIEVFFFFFAFYMNGDKNDSLLDLVKKNILQIISHNNCNICHINKLINIIPEIKTMY